MCTSREHTFGKDLVHSFRLFIGNVFSFVVESSILGPRRKRRVILKKRFLPSDVEFMRTFREHSFGSEIVHSGRLFTGFMFIVVLVESFPGIWGNRAGGISHRRHHLGAPKYS